MPIDNQRNTKKYNNALKNEREMHDDWTKKHSKICIYQIKVVSLQQILARDMKHTFSASRVTGGNVVFPDQLVIDDNAQMVTYRKKKLIGYDETTIRFSAIGSVSRSAGLIFCDVSIETNGGVTILANGFSRSDANAIVKLLNNR